MKQQRALATTLILTSLVLTNWAAGAWAADPPAATPVPASSAAKASSPAKSCKSLKGDALKECRTVAASMKRSEGTADGRDANKAVGVHSSSIMIDDKERAIAEAKRKGKDPRKAVEKIEEKEKAPATQP